SGAPGGPNEQDLVNQPRDMSFVITRLLAQSGARSGYLAGRIDPRKVAVSGQSDGGDTALAVGFDPRYQDDRVGAAVILSGAEIPFLSKIRFSSPSPPLLAIQGRRRGRRIRRSGDRDRHWRGGAGDVVGVRGRTRGQRVASGPWRADRPRKPPRSHCQPSRADHPARPPELHGHPVLGWE